MVRVRQGEALLEIAHHDGGVSRVHPVVGVPVAVVVATVSLLVDVVRVFKQRHPLRAVDDRRAGGGQGVIHKVLQPGAVHGDDIRTLDLFHVVHRQGIVVEAAHRAGVQPLHGDALHALGNGPGEEIDRIGGGQDGQPLLLGGARGGLGAAGKQEQDGQEHG